MTLSNCLTPSNYSQKSDTIRQLCDIVTLFAKNPESGPIVSDPGTFPIGAKLKFRLHIPALPTRLFSTPPASLSPSSGVTYRSGTDDGPSKGTSAGAVNDDFSLVLRCSLVYCSLVYCLPAFCCGWLEVIHRQSRFPVFQIYKGYFVSVLFCANIGPPPFVPFPVEIRQPVVCLIPIFSVF